ncbi:helix-hairpin-helix domain-containing protein [Mariprofundus erugo]|uniref:helix-hairpin-helix domain-containing protein n=1 Tax=Mariprofundus erugo TaxID=2528639 RepID=UPI0010FE3403|nr:helix-hairpin-helix domain-containing protein [Mariprofundus erugo]TLS75822.1 helix-hairpin-helix domain-containing protein [Mariprofundus erugo]
MKHQLTDIPGIGESTAAILAGHGIDSVKALSKAGVSGLMQVPGFGGKRAETVMHALAALQGEDVATRIAAQGADVTEQGSGKLAGKADKEQKKAAKAAEKAALKADKEQKKAVRAAEKAAQKADKAEKKAAKAAEKEAKKAEKQQAKADKAAGKAARKALKEKKKEAKEAEKAARVAAKMAAKGLKKNVRADLA